MNERSAGDLVSASVPLDRSSRIGDLVAIARPDHWPKHVFIVPGVLAALGLSGTPEPGLLTRLLLGFFSATLVASANYVINEWLDAEHDRHHPIKGLRPAASKRLSARTVYVEYAGLAAVGLAVAALVSLPYLMTSAFFLGSGVLYNVPPVRTKERVHLDIATEAINNPIRLLLGWFMVSSVGVPPTSLVLLYWCGGGFLMSTKRLAEYRYLMATSDVGLAGRYRKSFAKYDERALLVASLSYAILASFCLAVFLIKYRTEYVLTMPLFAWLFAHQLYVALDEASIAQTPEKFYRQRGLLPIAVALVLAVAVLSVVDIPALDRLIHSRFPAVERR